MREALPPMDDVDEVPAIAKRFRAALEQMRTTIGHLLEGEKKASA
jgi:hypothetical protein